MNDEHVFDYMAAAEESGRQLDLMMRQVPGHIKTTLTEEWRRLPILAELPRATEKMGKATENLNNAIKRIQASNKLLRQTIWATAIVLIFSVIAVQTAIWLFTKCG